jgi:hypothetical protein
LSRASEGSSSGRDDADALAIAEGPLDALKLHNPIDEGKQGVVRATAHVVARQHGGTPLANEDRAGRDRFTPIGLNAKTLGVGIAAIPRGACAFLMSHGEDSEKRERKGDDLNKD